MLCVGDTVPEGDAMGDALFCALKDAVYVAESAADMDSVRDPAAVGRAMLDADSDAVPHDEGDCEEGGVGVALWVMLREIESLVLAVAVPELLRHSEAVSEREAAPDLLPIDADAVLDTESV